MLYQEAPGVDPFWTASARTLFLGIGLYVFETPTLPKTESLRDLAGRFGIEQSDGL